MTEGYLIGVGLNVALPSLTDIQSVSVGGMKIPGPKVWLEYDPGDLKDQTNFNEYASGYPSVTWMFGFLLFAQFYYFQSTYCTVTATTGPVTIYTTLFGQSFSRMNATIHVPKPSSLRGFTWPQQVPILFSALRPAS